MQGEFPPHDFLEYLNRYLRVKSPDTVELIRSGEQSDDLTSSEKLEFAVRVDLVICGPCGGYGTIGVEDRREYNEDFPMGKCAVAKGEPDESWLHAVLESLGTKPKNIVVYPTCCGPYPAHYTRMLRRVFSEIAWSFPEVEDLCDNHRPERVARGLLKAGILKVIPA